jgi:hypothetical protein
MLASRMNDMLIAMNRALLAAVAVLVLSACAGNRYYPVEEAGSGRYYLGESPAIISYRSVNHAPLLLYGLSPWWGYSYYSPFFYPHYFSVSYSPWPYYAPWPYYGYWPVGHSYWHPPYHHYRYGHPGRYPGHDPGDEMAGMPPPGAYVPPVTPPPPSAERLRMLDDLTLQREARRSVTPAGRAWNSPTVGRSVAPQPSVRAAPPGSLRGPAPGGRSLGLPSGPTVGGQPASRSGARQGTVSRHNPRRHDQ